MIDIEEARRRLEDGDQPAVVYRPYPGAVAEDGTITRVGISEPPLVFVRYGSDRQAKATYCSDLEWLSR